MKIGYNPSVMMAYNNLSSTNNAIEKTARALSTGLRAASASDDAAGFAITLRLSSQVSGLERAIRNTQDGVSMLQTAEGGLNQINSMLQRMRELATQASNDTLTSQDRNYLQLEIEELQNNIDNIAQNTTFNRKRLLDGSSAGAWTSNENNTKVHINGALTSIDQFGQKKSAEGNYRIEIRAKPGQAEVQKSSLFNVTVIDDTESDAFPEPSIRIDLNNLSEGDSGEGWEFNDGILNLTDDVAYSVRGTGSETTNRISVSASNASVYLSNVNINVSGINGACAFDMSGANVNLYLKGTNFLSSGDRRAAIELSDSSDLTITSASGDGKAVGRLYANATGIYGAGIGSAGSDNSCGNITINGGIIEARGSNQAAGIGSGAATSGGNITINAGEITAYGGVQGAGIGTGHGAGEHETVITIAGGTVKAYGGSGGGVFNASGIGGGCHSASGTITIREDLIKTGMVTAISGGKPAEAIGHGYGYENGEIDLNADIPAPDFSVSINRPATLDEISNFYDVNGNFIFSEPQTITITQGDGKKANVTLYSSDTMYDVANKINDAISENLGQGFYVDNTSRFCTISDGTENTSESVCSQEAVYNSDGSIRGYVTNATMIVRSAIAGSSGRLTFSSDNEDLISALGLNTIQESIDSKFTASVYEAHTGETVAKNVEFDGNRLNGIIHKNIDVEFDPSANIQASWDEATKRYILSSNEKEPYVTKVHITDRSTAFQIGQNIGEDIYINIGDMTSSSLGLSGINLKTREHAVEAMRALDVAIHKVSLQRSKIGTYQNELEYNANSLTQTSKYLSASESRIKDTNMALEVIEYVKLQILNNSGSSMLSQANQTSQSVSALLNL